MSGHSKWATIKRHKAAQDAKKGKIFSVLSKELTLAARASGGDINFNPRLRTVVLKAKAANMPSDNVDRAIKKGTGELPGVVYEEITYEGYGPGGVAIVVEVTTDNKNRSVSEVRSAFTKHGGKLAGSGALATKFHRKGQFIIDREKATEDRLMEIALELGADDVLTEETYFEIRCTPGAFDTISQALEKAGIPAESSEIAQIPHMTVPVAEADNAKKILHLVETLEELEDVQHVYHDGEIDHSLVE